MQDVVAIDGHDERLVQRGDDLVRDVVAGRFERRDPGGALRPQGQIVDQRQQLAGPLRHVLGGSVEEVVEDQLPWNDLERHRVCTSPRCEPGGEYRWSAAAASAVRSVDELVSE